MHTKLSAAIDSKHAIVLSVDNFTYSRFILSIAHTDKGTGAVFNLN